MTNAVRWNLQNLGSAIGSLEAERERLAQENFNMQEQSKRVGMNWRSPAGMQYQHRLVEDLTVLGNILNHLQARIGSLRNVERYYAEAEATISRLAGTLPR